MAIDKYERMARTYGAQAFVAARVLSYGTRGERQVAVDERSEKGGVVDAAFSRRRRRYADTICACVIARHVTRHDVAHP